MENNNLNVLDEINKGSTMGMDAIDYILDKVKDTNFREVLNDEYKKYSTISDRIKNIYPNYTTEKAPTETNTMNKVMTWYGIQMNTIKNQSVSKLSELLIQGTNMGIIEGRKLLNNNGNLPQEINCILNDFVSMQENSVETLKKYL